MCKPLVMNASAAAVAVAELLPVSQPARHLLTAVNRHAAAMLLAQVENDQALNAVQDLILSFRGPIAPEVRQLLEAILDDLDRCAVCGQPRSRARAVTWPPDTTGSVN